MDSSKRASSTDSKKAIDEGDLARPDITDDDFDRSSPLSSGQVLRRALQDGSGQDYFVYVPAAGAVDAPVLVVLHDVDRDARTQAQAFAALSERYGAVLVAPHFSSERYPNYQRLGRSRAEADHRRSANEALDVILEEVSSLCGASTEKVYLFGFGGGGRFSMRYAMLHPERVAGAVIAEPGAYTFPDEGRRFPQGIAPSRKRPDFQPEPSRFLRVPMALLENESELGDSKRARLEDVDRMEEGPERREGRDWVEAMKAAAAEHDIPPAVAYGQIGSGSKGGEQTYSFAEFAASFDLMETVFEILLGSKKAELAPDPDPTAQAKTDAAREVDSAAARARWAKLRRVGVAFLLVCGLAALVVPLAIWGQYRSMHIVAQDAVVRGHIADLGAPLDGVVRTVEVDNGDRVVAGQIVVRLEDRQFDAKRRRAESQLEKARRELEVERLAIINERARLESSLRGVSADLSAAGAGVQVAESRAQEALRRLELQRKLQLDGLVAAERVRTAETEYRTARAQVSAARAERTSARAGEELAETNYDGLAVREKRVSVLESEISALEAELAVAQANLEGAVIRAPEDGAVVRRIVEPGGSTVVGQPIISLWLGQELWVEAWIDESALGEIAIGSRATITFKSHPNREFGGTVESLAVSTDMELPDSEVPQPRSERMRDAPVVSVRVKLDEAEKDLFPGLSAVVAIRKKDR